ncbi:MAG: ATP-binding protein, partial [Acidobacteriota bacterium]|nr:ATP-binding protein [Acidobacteriota bacterium]
NLSVEEYADKTARLWRDGLASWNQDGERIARLRQAVDMAIYTPGSNAGLPLSVLRSLSAPPQALIDDGDAMRERVLGAVSGLLALLGIDADPIKSREHILLSTILDHTWRSGRSLGLADLIREIQKPPVQRIGVFDLEAFYPEKDRLDLAMTLNNLLASPGFSAWLEGEPLDVPRLLWTAGGKPRISIMSIAHLSDPERMFFVTLLLNEVVAWMRTQAGTTSLRALLYMDEVFGYFPPSANPPSKTPMLTLMKQARAFGLGVVLATQNPVDLDYKGLSNAGTWLLGRLQTERDKARVLDGLEGAAASTKGGFNRRRVETILSGMKSRVFLMNNVHDDGPAVFHTRWAMSYLRGPLTRTQIKQLMDPRREAPASPAGSATMPAAAAPAATRPVAPAGLAEAFLPLERPAPASSSLVYRPALFGAARLHFVSARDKVDEWRDVALCAPLSGDDVPEDPWEESDPLDLDPRQLADVPVEGAGFGELPAALTRPKAAARWGKALASHLYRDRELTLWRSASPKATSTPEETEGDFRARLAQLMREKRDLEIDKLRKRYAPKLARLQERIRTAEERVDREKSQYRQQKTQTAISIGATVLGALFGRKTLSASSVGRATTAMRGASRASRDREDVGRAAENVERLVAQLEELEAEFQEKAAELEQPVDPTELELDSKSIRPRKSDIGVGELKLLWMPWHVGRDGIAVPAFG